MYFKRKIDEFLLHWKQEPSHKPLIVKGARQIGKTESIMHFAKENYSNVVYINFVFDKIYANIVSDGYDVATVIKNITLANPAIRFIPVEVKSNNDRSRSLSALIKNENYSDIHCGIKLGDFNVGYANQIYTFPYFCTFLLKEYLKTGKMCF